MKGQSKKQVREMIWRYASKLGRQDVELRSTMSPLELETIEAQLKAEVEARLLAAFTAALPEFVKRYNITVLEEPSISACSAVVRVQAWNVTTIHGHNGWTISSFWTQAEAEHVAQVLRECSARRHATGTFAETVTVDKADHHGLVCDHDLRMAGLMPGYNEVKR